MSLPTKIIDILKYALNSEVEASKLYFIAIGKTHDRDVKKLLEMLSKDEEEHFLTLLKIFNKITEGIPNFTYTNDDREKAVANIADKIKKAGFNSSSTVGDIILFAISEEKAAQLFYKRCIQENKELDLYTKNILNKLVKEEIEHEKSLANMFSRI